jgi:hypothetical protein
VILSLIAHLLFNPWSLGVLGVVAVIGVGLYFTIGPVKLLKLAFDLRTWAVIAGITAVVAYAHLEQQNEALQAKVQTQQQQTVATDDGTKVTQLRVQQQTKRTGQSQRIHRSISQPRPETDAGDAEDAVLDQIARERGQHVPAPPVHKTPTPKPAPVLAPKPEVQNDPQPVPVAPVVAQRVPDRPAVPAPHGVRKRPDITIVP